MMRVRVIERFGSSELESLRTRKRQAIRLSNVIELQFCTMR